MKPVQTKATSKSAPARPAVKSPVTAKQTPSPTKQPAPTTKQATPVRKSEPKTTVPAQTKPTTTPTTTPSVKAREPEPLVMAPDPEPIAQSNAPLSEITTMAHGEKRDARREDREDRKQIKQDARTQRKKDKQAAKTERAANKQNAKNQRTETRANSGRAQAWAESAASLGDDVASLGGSLIDAYTDTRDEMSEAAEDLAQHDPSDKLDKPASKGSTAPATDPVQWVKDNPIAAVAGLAGAAFAARKLGVI